MDALTARYGDHRRSATPCCEYCHRHKFKGVYYHAPRHAYGSHLRSLGYDTVTAAAIMGHFPQSMTRLAATPSRAEFDRSALASGTPAKQPEKPSEDE